MREKLSSTLKQYLEMPLDFRAFWKFSTKSAYSCLHENTEKHTKKSIGKRRRLQLDWLGPGHNGITNMREAQEKLK